MRRNCRNYKLNCRIGRLSEKYIFGLYKFDKATNARVFPFSLTAKGDTTHLPGGNRSRTGIIIKNSRRLNIEIMTYPSSKV